MTRREAILLLAGLAVSPIGCKSVLDPRPTIRLANWGGAGDGGEFFELVQRLYREFEAKSGIRLRVEGTPGSQEYTNKLLLDYICGSMPDVVTLDASSAAAFIDNGALLDLRPYVRRDNFDTSVFYENVLEIGERGDKLFAIPTDFTPMVVYCNLKHFREADVELPSGRWTFDEFLRAAVKLTAKDRFGLELANWMPGWVMFLWNNGGDVLSPDGATATGYLDSPQSVEAVQFLADLVLKHKAAPDLSQAAMLGADLFATGRASMKVVGHWNLITVMASKDISIEDVAVVELPTNLPQSVTVFYEAGNAIGAKCKRPDLAWEFIKYFSSFDTQVQYNSSGIAVCGRKDVEASKIAKKSLAGNDIDPAESASLALDKSFDRIVPMARAPWGAKVEGYDRVETMGQKAFDAILKNGVPVKKALSQAAREIDEEFAKR